MAGAHIVMRISGGVVCGSVGSAFPVILADTPTTRMSPPMLQLGDIHHSYPVPRQRPRRVRRGVLEGGQLGLRERELPVESFWSTERFGGPMISGFFTTESAEAAEPEGKGFSKSLDPDPFTLLRLCARCALCGEDP